MTSAGAKYGPLLALLALALAGSTFHLGDKAVWNDEAFSYFVARDGPGQAIYNISTDPHPPLYYVILSLVLPLGSGPIFLRAASAIAHVVATGLVYGSAATLFNRRIAAIAAVLFAINPELVDFAQKARPYAMQTMFVAMAFWGMAKVMSDDFAREHPIGGGFRGSFGGRGIGVDIGWCAYIVGAAGAMLTQHPGGFFVLSANVVAVLRLASNWRAMRQWFLNWALAQVLMLALWSLWLPGFIHQMAALIVTNTTTRNPAYFITAGQLWGAMLSLFSVSFVWSARYAAWAIYLLGIVLGLRALRRYRFAGVVVLVPTILPAVIGIVGLYILHPIFGYAVSTMHWMQIPYVMVIAAGIGSIGRTVLRGALVSCFVIANAWGLKNYYQTPNPPTDELVATLERNARPGDGIIFSEYTVPRFVVGYYLGAKAPEIRGLDLTRDGSRLIRSLAEAQKNPRNWVILAGDQRSSVDLEQLSGGRPPDFTRDFGAYTLIRFDMPPAQ